MNIKFSRAFLMSGKDYKLTPSITLHHPTLEEIMSLCDNASPDDIYYEYIYEILCDPYSNMVMLDDLGKNYLETTPFDILILRWHKIMDTYENNKEMFDSLNLNPTASILSALQFFIVEKHDFTLGHYDNGMPCLYDKSNIDCQINEEIFHYICEWVKAINKIEAFDKIKPADENARRILIEDMRSELKKSQKRKKNKDEDSDVLGLLMASASFCGNGSLSPFHLLESKIYWLNESFSINSKKEHAFHLLDGIYHGTLNSKDISKKELDWAK